jgi:oxygen-independent coproporphyrinogen-3 oxidase
LTPLALYFHWPYCRRICPYCDFNVTRDRGQTDRQQALFEAMLTDLRTQAAWVGSRSLVSLYFGGGTPSLMQPEWVAALVTEAKRLFAHETIEITLEANPTDVEISKYRDFATAGVNRLSLGVQSLNDQALLFLGRDHRAHEAILGIGVAREVFERVSLDLIYALPDQGLDDWAQELRRAAALGVEHISPYQLSIEPDTAFGRAVRRKKWQPVPQEAAESFYFKTLEVLEGLGFTAYEVSNHAISQAAQAVHNVAIWRGADYLGIGPGAHGRFRDALGLKATIGTSDLKTYGKQVEAVGYGCAITPLSALEADEEALMLGLRMSEGVQLSRLKTLNISTIAEPLVADGFLELTPTHLMTTPKGRLVLDRLLYTLLS